MRLRESGTFMNMSMAEATERRWRWSEGPESESSAVMGSPLLVEGGWGQPCTGCRGLAAGPEPPRGTAVVQWSLNSCSHFLSLTFFLFFIPGPRKRNGKYTVSFLRGKISLRFFFYGCLQATHTHTSYTSEHSLPRLTWAQVVWLDCARQVVLTILTGAHVGSDCISNF